MSGYLTTHVLDTARGAPAEGVRVDLFALEDGVEGERELLKSTRTNADGRTEEPLLAPGEIRVKRYELVFHVGEYFADTEEPPFLGEVPVRFGVSREGEHYHVPLLVSPGAYSTYRGS